MLFTIYIGGVNASLFILFTLGIDVVTVAIYYIYIVGVNASSFILYTLGIDVVTVAIYYIYWWYQC